MSEKGNKGNYDINVGDLVVGTIKTLKNLNIALDGTGQNPYHITIPEKWIVQSYAVKDEYVDSQKTGNKFEEYKLISYDVGAVLLENGLSDQLSGIKAIQVHLPLFYESDFEPVNNETVVTLTGVQLKPLWVTRGKSGSYSAIRIEADSISKVDTVGGD